MHARSLLLHAAHVLLPAIVLASVESSALQLIAATALFFALFTLLHDAMHGALGLPRKVNAAIIALAGAAVAVAGHATRRLHLRHHAAPFTPGDIEGRGVTVPFPSVLLEGPRAYLELPREGW